MKSMIIFIDKWMARFVTTLVTLVMISMIIIGLIQVLSRNLIDQSLPWGDIVLRHLVIWVGMLGGLLATRQGRQISIDIFSRIGSSIFRKTVNIAGNIFAFAVCLFLTYASWTFVLGEKEFGGNLYGSFPVWWAQIIIPIGFTLISIQLIINLLLSHISRDSGDDPDRNNIDITSDPDNKTSVSYINEFEENSETDRGEDNP